ncbi:hypothetical protein [Mycobacterium sp.]|uniref:hypothetical protein n=1 Tax=Mycobacterium sp. TaxID=1785 RepID=UPI003BAA39E5
MTRSGQSTARPFTLALCAACRSHLGSTALERLAATVSRTEHGVLVTAGCLLGEFTCLARRDVGKTVLMLQPCSVDRVACGPARWIGVTDNVDDLQIVCAWLERGNWERDHLPGRLRLTLPMTRRSIAAN